MVAYSFQAQFREPILAGTKRQTLRNERKRHARAGEALQLYTGMRTRQCRLIGTARCDLIMPMRLDLECGRVESLATGNAWTTIDELDEFARADGFADWRAMHAFWAKHHPDAKVWSGVRILWSAFRPNLPPEGGQ